MAATHARLLLLLQALLQAPDLLQARIGFKKDQKEDVMFPPRVQQGTDGIPTGHLRPLGYHRHASGPVEEELKLLKPSVFNARYVSTKKPVVLRQAVGHVPAMERWKSDDYLRQKYGKLEVHTVVKKQGVKHKLKQMAFSKFLADYHYDDLYLSNIVPAEMMRELVLPDFLRCGFADWLVESEMWMSSGGTSSLIHSHADHNLHCVLSGRKDFIVIDPKFKAGVHYEQKSPQVGAGVSPLDVDMINMFEHGHVKHVEWTWATLKRGDCILIPATVLHQVRSYGRSISSTVLWAPSPALDLAGCDDIEYPDNMKLSDSNFAWTYVEADEQLANKKLNASAVRHLLELFMREEDSLRYDVFNDEHHKIMALIDDPEVHGAMESWKHLMPPANTTHLSRDMLKKLTDSQLEKMAVALNTPYIHPVHHNEL